MMPARMTTIPVLLGGRAAGLVVADSLDVVQADGLVYTTRRLACGRSPRRAVRYRVPSGMELGDAVALAWDYLVEHAFPGEGERRPMVYKARSVEEAPDDAQPGDVLITPHPRSTRACPLLVHVRDPDGWQVAHSERRGTAEEWARANPVLPLWVVGVETSAPIRAKRGDGERSWNALPYLDDEEAQELMELLR